MPDPAQSDAMSPPPTTSDSPSHTASAAQQAESSTGTFVEVLWAFFRLGLTSFGGPVAHLGYFRTEFVQRRKWLDDASYSDLVALCQFLPGPASSQVGMALGMGRCGWRGALAAWLGFTLPSAVVLVLFALGMAHWQGLLQSGVVHGLKIVAVAVVAQALWGMARTLCLDRLRAGIALLAALGVLAIPSAAGQIAVMVGGALLGRYLIHVPPPPASVQRNYGVSPRTGMAVLVLLVVLLVMLPLAAAMTGVPVLKVVSDFFQAGALVFGGGHVVLPLLQASVVPDGWLSNEAFLAGYGAAQAVPGPLFTFAAYLGAAMSSPFGGWIGGLALLVTLFVPALLLVVGVLPYWEALRQRPYMQSTMAGVNAAVVGLLGAALYDPVWTSAIHSRTDLGIALAAWGLLVFARLSPVLVVLLAAVAGGLFAH